MQYDGETVWDGVRNYQARNYLRQMEPGDLAFFYHSNIKPPGIVGLVRVKEEKVVDPTQFDRHSPYFDPKATPESPRWITVTVEYLEMFPNFLPLKELKAIFSPEQLPIIKRGNRLSVIPVEAAIAEHILQLAGSAIASNSSTNEVQASTNAGVDS